ncbi:hypothetical protein P8C59_008551 [Phyllachora maydis]|uniref:FHA domain-containing protein n=1 Tax=Phyllachora maydis TaxID=1825666 RepID=A0AAD9ICH9_9PEZI|nr:hypothetical protein P8C59_008551 [Phyllachora maydis]
MDKPASSVLVSLSADDTISHHVTYPERRIKLDAEHRSVLIGRSSKASTKNLLALPSNAWFDSPVMSRNHAEITANLKERKVQIRDMQSLHGTYINCDENKVGCHAQDLKDGDMLRFGIPVIRGGEVFPPTAVKVALTFYEADPTPTPSRTFQVPESSDVSDEEDSSGSDSDSEPGDLPQPTQTKNLFGEEDEEEDYDGGSIRLSTDDEDEKASMDEAEAELECDIDEMLGNECDWDSRSDLSASSENCVNSGPQQHHETSLHCQSTAGPTPMEESIWGLDLEPRALINGPNPVKKAAPSPARSSSTTKLPQLKNDSSTYTAKHGLLSSESAAPELLDSETGRLDDKITVVPSMPCRAEVTTVRPVKRARLRKLVEGIGYAAVGGLTVGTLVFGSLVYTAPSMG